MERAMNALRPIAFGLLVLVWPCRSVLAQDAAIRAVTPIEHLIVVVGENITFDNLFATYRPPAGESVGNLLSRGIVNQDGRPGPNFARATQREAAGRERYALMPTIAATYGTLPQPCTTQSRHHPPSVSYRR